MYLLISLHLDIFLPIFIFAEIKLRLEPEGFQVVKCSSASPSVIFKISFSKFIFSITSRKVIEKMISMLLFALLVLLIIQAVYSSTFVLLLNGYLTIPVLIIKTILSNLSFVWKLNSYRTEYIGRMIAFL